MANKTIRIDERYQVRKGADGTLLASQGGVKWLTPAAVGLATEAALNTKVDKSSTASVLYGRNTANVEAAIPMTEAAATPWTIPRRDSAGRIKVVSAASTEDAVNKSQMDAADALKVNKAGDTMTGPLGATNITALGGNASYNGGYPTYTLNNGSKKWDIYETGDGSMVFKNTTDNLAPITIRANTPQPMLELYSGGVQLLSSLIPRANGTGSIGMENFRFANVQTLKVTVNGPLIVSGTGFPNGVVSAPVGSTYIDTNATNGAIEWKKATGTGNTGWVVSVGDTGWMNITSLLINGWTATQVRVRRVGNQIFYGFENLSASTMTDILMVAPPSGFRSTGTGANSERQFLTTAANPAQVWRITTSGTAMAVQGASTSLGSLYGSLSFMTNDPYPTTLPGTAL